MRSILMLLLPILPAALLVADTHDTFAEGQVDVSAFKTFVVRQGDPKSQQPSPEVDPKLNQAVRDAIRSALSSRGIKETPSSPELIANYRVEVSTQRKEVTGIVVIDLTDAATDTTIWHGQHIDDEGSSAKLEKRLPDAIRKILSDNAGRKK